MKTRAAAVLSILVVAVAVVLASGDQVRERELQQAIDLIESKGDLKAATPLLEDVAKSADRGLAARGLLYLAQAQERYGKNDARATYQRIVSDFGGPAETPVTSDAAGEARRKLESLAPKDGVVSRKIAWDGHPDLVSPDGRYLTFEDDHNDVGVHDLSSGKDRMLTFKAKTTESFAGISVPSPDSQFIAYNWWDSDTKADDLRVIGRDGGQPRVIAASDSVPQGWTPDGKWILAIQHHRETKPETRELVLIPVSGGSTRLLKHLEPSDPNGFFISPDGRFVAYSRPAAAGKPERDVISMSLDTGLEALIVNHPADDYVLDWFPKGDRVLFASDRGGGLFGIWSTAVIEGRGLGEAVPVKLDTGLVHTFGFTSKGDFYYTLAGNQTQDVVYLATLDPSTGKQTGPLKLLEGRYLGGMMGAVWSPRGDRLAYMQVTTPDVIRNSAFRTPPDIKLAIHTIATGDVRLLALDLREMRGPEWLTDGRLTVQGTDLQGRQGLFLVNIETGALTTVAYREPQWRSQPVLSPDGGRIFFLAPTAGSTFAGPVVVRDLTSGADKTLIAGPINNWVQSPDGRWLAGVNSRDNPGAFVVASSGGEPRSLGAIGNNWLNARVSTWSPDSRFVLAVKHDTHGPDEIWQVPLDGSAPRNVGVSGLLGDIRRISAHPDGQRLAISTWRSVTETWVLQNLPKR